MDSVSHGGFTRIQGYPGGGTDGGIDIKIGEFYAFFSHGINVRCFHKGIAETGRVGITHVINKDDHHIGFLVITFIMGDTPGKKNEKGKNYQPLHELQV